jgi:serine phosphatase RsbU (regulator of sigma subunit)
MKSGLFNTGFPKVRYAFLFIMAIITANVAANLYIILKNRQIILRMTDLVNPYIASLEKLNLLVTESKMYSTNWVYLQNNVDDKNRLDTLIRLRYPQLKTELINFASKLEKPAESDSLKLVFRKFDSLIVQEKAIMKLLVGFDDYESATKKFKGEEMIENEILPRSQEIFNTLSGVIKRNRDFADSENRRMESSSLQLMAVVTGSVIGIFIAILFTMAFISRAIRLPSLKMKSIISMLGKGELPEEKIQAEKNVIGEMADSVNALTESFKNTSLFANEIGKGNLSVHYEKLSENDLLGNALIHMRDSLRAYSADMESQVSERTKEVLEKGVKLEIAYREIRESIHYAKRIQESILPADEIMSRVFSDSFIFYRPKDIVCGDFYWFTQQGDDFVVAAIDCTGHGVPGALMTVIGNSIFNQVVNFGGVTDPAKILIQVDKKLMETLKQHGNITTNDGMDAAICRYRIAKREITFAGAKRPMYMFKNGELIEIKGNKSPIGSFGHDYDKRFTEQKFNMNAGDSIYLFSDGLQDQFGGADGKKFMIKRFRDLLSEIQSLPMATQAMRLETEVKKWQGEFEQTDDMLLIGIRF